MTRFAVVFLLLAAATAAQDILVVTPEGFRPALEEWTAHRRSQDLAVAVREPDADLRALVAGVHAKSGKKLRFVLLLGDVRAIPCAYEKGEIIKAWERDPRIASDNRFADLDGDGVPDLAIGRLPADNVEEAKELLGKVVLYEKNADFGRWRRRVNVIAGVGGFGELADWALEQVATKFLTTSIPYAYDLHVTYANPHSPFCPPPDEVQRTAIERFNEGALVVAYLGHGSRRSLDRLRFGRASYDIFDEEAAYSLEARHGAPVAFFVACSTGHMDGAPDCLAEVVLKRPKGPVAVIASSRVSMPYANGVIAKEVLDAVFLAKKETIGEAFLEAKRWVLEAKPGDEGRQFMEALALGYQWDAKKREQERAEHIHLYNLFGDPSMRLPRPAEIEVECAAEAQAGARLEVGGAAGGGTALVELVAERTAAVPGRRGDDRESFAKTYAAANTWVRASASVPVDGGRFAAELALPDRPGTYFVRVYVTGPEGALMGAKKVAVKPRAE